jgi:hypothetical protein
MNPACRDCANTPKNQPISMFQLGLSDERRGFTMKMTSNVSIPCTLGNHADEHCWPCQSPDLKKQTSMTPSVQPSKD